MDENQLQVPTRKGRGRPSGQFDYHKLCVLKYLQAYSAENDQAPFSGSNKELSESIGEWGKTWRVSVSERQVARYLLKLQAETTSGGIPRIEIYVTRHKVPNKPIMYSKRYIKVNDTRPLNI